MPASKGDPTQAASPFLGRHTLGLDWGPRGVPPEPAPDLGGTSPAPLPQPGGWGPSRGQSYAPTVNKMSLAGGAGALPRFRREIGWPDLFRQFFRGYAGVSSGFPPRPRSRANPSPRAARCLTNKGWTAGLWSGISPPAPKPLISNLLWGLLAVAGGPARADGTLGPRWGNLPRPFGAGARKVAPRLGLAMAQGRAERRSRELPMAVRRGFARVREGGAGGRGQ